MNSHCRWLRVSLFATLLLAGEPLRAAEPATPGAPTKSELEQRAARLVLPKLEFRDATLVEGVQFLRMKARQLDPGHQDLNIAIAPAALGNEAKITLSLNSITLPEALHYVAAKAGLAVRYGATEISVEPAPAAEWNRRKMPATPESAKVKENALAIIIPKIEFREASLTEALDFLGQKARQLDPAQRGINIVNLDLPVPDARLTLKLTNVPLFEALTYVANLAGGELVAEPEALIVRQKGE